MRQDDRQPFVDALAEARRQAYSKGEFVDQESFMQASEILELARRAGITQASRVLDLCCGVAGPGRHIVRHLACGYLGLDYSASALEIAGQRARAEGLACSFEVAYIPPLPTGTNCDIVLLLETMLAFADKPQILSEMAGCLPVGGRLALTFEEGSPLRPSEQMAMPDSDTVWLTPLSQMLQWIEEAGFGLSWQHDCSRQHLQVAESLLTAFQAQEGAISSQIGARALHDLVEAHRLWVQWLRSGRVRKFALVAEKS